MREVLRRALCPLPSLADAIRIMERATQNSSGGKSAKQLKNIAKIARQWILD